MIPGITHGIVWDTETVDIKGDGPILDFLLARSCDDPRHYALTFGEVFCYGASVLAWIVALVALSLVILGTAYAVRLLNR